MAGYRKMLKENKNRKLQKYETQLEILKYTNKRNINIFTSLKYYSSYSQHSHLF